MEQNIKFHVGDKVRILRYPGYWASGAGGDFPGELPRRAFPMEGVIERLDYSTHTNVLALKVNGYGFGYDPKGEPQDNDYIELVQQNNKEDYGTEY